MRAITDTISVRLACICTKVHIRDNVMFAVLDKHLRTDKCKTSSLGFQLKLDFCQLNKVKDKDKVKDSD